MAAYPKLCQNAKHRVGLRRRERELKKAFFSKLLELDDRELAATDEKRE